ncbi:DUF4190 domain-containing protein [Aggregicoccus sp. 17bor-14]|uniref:DUF4190 domain-containing protein n=1 Tax=Myxococcaceae TaxID=31 RepID=UPI00129CF533|nr:DUF4190 domain-containing protein [Simulacricoccus sp. 17bor-14]MRI87624.1 DUF4190 domain-containing protein [Aggregicoccus sp. 17bor-14]
MSSCPTCGAALSADARFCPACGTAVSPGAPPPAAATTGVPLPGNAAPRTSAPRTSTMAIVALVLASIPACLLNVVGIVLGVVALNEIKRQPALQGRGLAKAAIIVGSVWLAFMLVGVGAAIAIPNYIKFQARSKQAEASRSLRALNVQLEQAGGEVQSFSQLSWSPGDKRRYSYFLADDALPATLGGPYSLPDEDALPEGWRAVAVGNVDNDDTLDVWVVESDGTLSHPVDDLTE